MSTRAKLRQPKCHVVSSKIDDVTRLQLEYLAKQRETTISDLIASELEALSRAPIVSRRA
jgi:hypothetical protein